MTYDGKCDGPSDQARGPNGKNMSDILKSREIIFEYQTIGHLVRVSAMDTETMTEVVIQGPASAGDAVLQGQAAKRLEYVLRKKGILG